MEGYTIEIEFALIYAAYGYDKGVGNDFPVKITFYCVIKQKRRARNDLLLTRLFLHLVWQLPWGQRFWLSESVSPMDSQGQTAGKTIAADPCPCLLRGWLPLSAFPKVCISDPAQLPYTQAE